jgi:glucosamine--fructose-6-phosphate aminotransferase (isomerizing)
MSTVPGTTHLERQILSQPDALQDVLDSSESREQVREAAQGLHRARRIWVVGTGTSEHAALLGAAMLQEAGRSAVGLSSMHFVNWAPNVGPQDALIVITHTGETAYALTARAQAVLAGLTVVTIGRRGLAMNDLIETVSKETSETYTVSYTSALLALAMLAHEMGADGFSSDKLAVVPGVVRNAIEAPGVEGIPAPGRALVIVGEGPASVTAREGALKVREASRTLAEGFDVEYLLHGSAVPLGPEDHIVSLTPPDSDGFLPALAAAAEREGIGVSRLNEPSPLPVLLAQIPLTARLQVLALRLAVSRGQDPDIVITGAWADEKLWEIGLPRT